MGAAQAGRVGDRLGEAAAASVRHSRKRVAPAAFEARVAGAVPDRNRAEQPQVVQVQHHGGAGRARGRQCAPAEQRVDVVGMNDVGVELDDGTADRVGL